MERLAPQPGGGNPYLVVRTRFFDDVLLAAAREGVTQVGILAAGMDARAFRLDWPAGTTVFEVERAGVLAHKEKVLASLGAKPRARRVVVEADLREDWRAALAKAGHDATRPTAFLVEGLLCYLPDEATARAIFAAVASVAAPGSRLAFDVPGASFLGMPMLRSLFDALAARGIAWTFGTDDPERLLASAGWPDARVALPGDADVSHGRWPYPSGPRGIPGVPYSYLAVGRR
ncbi:MAG TPA: SAM-dependent methyltransferase, partial [Polyangiaceae bacterium]